jgi:hypothetical protein
MTCKKEEPSLSPPWAGDSSNCYLGRESAQETRDGDLGVALEIFD